jgi:hypothetical protein
MHGVVYNRSGHHRLHLLHVNALSCWRLPPPTVLVYPYPDLTFCCRVMIASSTIFCLTASAKARTLTTRPNGWNSTRTELRSCLASSFQCMPIGSTTNAEAVASKFSSTGGFTSTFRSSPTDLKSKANSPEQCMYLWMSEPSHKGTTKVRRKLNFMNFLSSQCAKIVPAPRLADSTRISAMWS